MTWREEVSVNVCGRLLNLTKEEPCQALETI